MKNLHLAKEFLKRENKKVLKYLNQKMKIESENLNFEKASQILNIIKQLKETQYVENISFEKADVLGIYKKDFSFTIVVLIFRNKNLIGSKNFKFSNIISDQKTVLENFILQNYFTKQNDAKAILSPLILLNKKYIEEILLIKTQKKIKILHPKNKEEKNLIEMAYQNAKNLFIKEKTQISLREKHLTYLQKKLFLNRFPKKIQCFDVSNICKSFPVAAMVTFINGKRDKTQTKLFNIKNFTSDISAIEESLYRHFSKEKQKTLNLPDLLIIDGGKQHLNVAIKVLKDLSIATVDIISIAKQNSRHDMGLTQEKIFLPYKKDPIFLDIKSPALFILQKIRDASHMVAISFHKKKRKKTITKSALDDIPNIGPLKKKILLKHFKSVKNLKKASLKDLEKLKKISKKDAINILKNL
jgi:excinuclease ABC subunit C